MNISLPMVRYAFSWFDAVCVAKSASCLEIYLITETHSDEAYERSAEGEEILTGFYPELEFDVHIRARNGRSVKDTVPPGTERIQASTIHKRHYSFWTRYNVFLMRWEVHSGESHTIRKCGDIVLDRRVTIAFIYQERYNP